MNPFDHMLNDEVYIVNSEGNRAGPFKTAFQNHEIQIFDENLDVVEGDKVVRALPNGKENQFVVLEVSFQQKFHAIPSHYTLRIEKEGIRPTAGGPGTSTTVNISNSQGIQIGDNNSQNICNSMRDLVVAIDNSSASEEEKETAKSKIRELLSNPTTAAVLGGAASAVLAAL